MRRWGHAALGLALGLGLLFPGSSDAAARRRSAADSVRVARRIVVGDQGIRIVGADSLSVRGGGRTRIGATRQDLTFEETPDDTLVRHRHGHRRLVDHGIVVDVGESDLVRLFSDAEVPAGEKVDGDVVAVFGSVGVEGQVAGDVVAVFGAVHLGPQASVGGDVVAVGGALDRAPGAVINGQSVALGFLPIRWGVPPLRLLLSTVAVCWALTLLVGWLLTLIFPGRMMRIASTVSQRTAGSLVLGVLSAPLLVIAIVLMLVTVIGVPLAILLPPTYVLALWAGQIAATYVLGCRLLRRPLDATPSMLPIVAGTLFVALFFTVGTLLSGPGGVIRTVALFLDLLGILLVIGLSTVGIGAVLLSRVGSRPGQPAAPGAPAAGAVPPVVAPAAAPQAPPSA